MNTQRKAELQRKLSMTSVPKPPADLASRIKQDIPRSIGAPRPAAAWWSAASMRIAASILVMIGAAYLAVRILSRAPSTEIPEATSMAARAAKSITQQESPSSAATSAAPAPATAADSPKPATVAPASTFAPERAAARLKKEDDEIGTGGGAQASKPTVPAVPRDFVAGAAPRERDLNTAAPPPAAAVAANAPPHTAAQTVARPAIAVTASEQAVAENRVERALQPAPGAVASGGVSETRRPAAESKTALDESVIASPRSAAAHSIAPSMFGISTDPAAIEIVRTAVQRGQQPTVVNVEAIVNYFAGAPDDTPRRMSLQVEGSPPPVLATARARIVRVTIDTPWSDAADAPVAATDAYLTVTFDANAVASQRLIGGSTSLTASQRIVLKNTSVTALYEIVLRPGLRNRQKVVTARLTYRDGSTGREQVLPAVLRVVDLDRAWLDASRRHRLATLGAIWGESLKNSTSSADVARRAEELAKQEPRDRKAHELAELASASSRLRNSGPTGSGR